MENHSSVTGWQNTGWQQPPGLLFGSKYIRGEKQYFTHCFHHSKIKFISSRCRVTSSINICLKMKNGQVLNKPQMRLLLKNPGGNFLQIQRKNSLILHCFLTWNSNQSDKISPPYSHSFDIKQVSQPPTQRRIMQSSHDALRRNILSNWFVTASL